MVLRPRRNGRGAGARTGRSYRFSPHVQSDRLPAQIARRKAESVNPARPREFGADSGRQLVSHVVCARPTRIAGGHGRRSGRARSVDRVGPSVKAAGEAADVAMSGAARRIDGEIAGAAVGAAIGSAGRGRAAPQTAVRHASARDRHGRGTRIQCPVLTGRASRGRMLRSTRQRDPGSLVNGSNHENRSEIAGFLSGAMAGAGWALPTVRLCGPGNHDARLLISQIPHSGGAGDRAGPDQARGSSAFVQKPVLSLCDAPARGRG
jgi:hypothetical protein